MGKWRSTEHEGEATELSVVVVYFLWKFFLSLLCFWHIPVVHCLEVVMHVMLVSDEDHLDLSHLESQGDSEKENDQGEHIAALQGLSGHP